MTTGTTIARISGAIAETTPGTTLEMKTVEILTETPMIMSEPVVIKVKSTTVVEM